MQQVAVLFPVGGFGSTLEYCIRNFSTNYTAIDASICQDGSMHGYSKNHHPVWFKDFYIKKDFDICSPVYPTKDRLSPAQTVSKWKDILADCKVVFVYFNSINQIERNILFQYHKLKNQHILEDLTKNSFHIWNSFAKNINNLDKWQARECLSYVVEGYYAEHNNILNSVNTDWLILNTDEILYDLPGTMLNIFSYLDSEPDSIQELNNFNVRWYEKQQYILNEYNCVCTIMEDIFNKNSKRHWEKVSVVGEAIVQARIRKHDINIKCYGMNDFPKNYDEFKEYIL